MDWVLVNWPHLGNEQTLVPLSHGVLPMNKSMMYKCKRFKYSNGMVFLAPCMEVKMPRFSPLRRVIMEYRPG